MAALHQRRFAEGGADRFPQRFRAVEDHQQAAVGAQTAALEIREQVLTDAGVFRRAIPQAERVFLAIGSDPECHDHAVLADVHAVDDQADQVERLERRGLHAASCAAVFVTNRRLTALLLVPRLRIVAGTGSRLRA
ncbi:MAG TPA: hypothetical protein VJV74_00550 [Terriglobia bacterium]|nr:hypothetical protein [Terriglobia bacterium]